MGRGNGDRLFERLLNILKDGDWYKVNEVADKLSLSTESLISVIENLEEAGIIQTVDIGGGSGNGMIRGGSFVDTFFDLPGEDDYGQGN